MCRVSLERSAGVCPGWGFGWLGFCGRGCPGQVELAGCVSLGPGLIVGFRLWIFWWRRSGWCSLLCFGRIWMVSISESRLAWASLVMGGLLGFGRSFLLCCWSDVGTSFWDTRYIHTFKDIVNIAYCKCHLCSVGQRLC